MRITIGDAVKTFCVTMYGTLSFLLCLLGLLMCLLHFAILWMKFYEFLDRLAVVYLDCHSI